MAKERMHQPFIGVLAWPRKEPNQSAGTVPRPFFGSFLLSATIWNMAAKSLIVSAEGRFRTSACTPFAFMII